MSKVIPENYIIKEENGFKGVNKVNKNGKETSVLGCSYLMCKVAKSYNKVYVLFMTMDKELHLKSIRGEDEFEGNIYDALFGDKCIYVLTDNKDGGTRWLLLDKELHAERDIGNVIIPDAYIEDEIYLKDSKYSLEVKDDEDNTYRLELSTGELSMLVRRKKEVKEEKEPDFYTIVIEKSGKMYYTYKSKELGRNTLLGVDKYIKDFEELLDLELEEREDCYVLEGVEMEVCKQLFSIIGSFGFKESLEGLHLVKEYCSRLEDGKSKLLENITKELSDGFVSLGKYEVKMYNIGTTLLALVKNDTGRIIVYTGNLGKDDGLMDADMLRTLVGIYDSCKSNLLKFKVTKLSEKSVDDTPKSRYGLPSSVENDKKAKAEVKEYNYEDCKVYELQLSVESKEEDNSIYVKMIVCGGFNYKPKQNRNVKNVVYRARQNKLFINIVR